MTGRHTLLWCAAMTFVVTTTAAADTACPRPKDRTRVTGGTDVRSDKDYPWQAYIDIEEGRSRCGGTLISRTLVLTAAHCIQPEGQDISWRRKETDFRISLGSIDAFAGRGEIRNVAQVIVHDNYKSDSLDYDIALLRLSEPSNLKPVHLDGFDGQQALSDTKLNVEDGVILGWGRTDRGDEKTFPSILQRAEVPVRSACELQTSKYGKINPRRLCAGGNEGIDTCKGDSGGPLLIGDTQVGITSFGTSEHCGEKGVYGVYTRVSAFSKFIKQHLSAAVSEQSRPMLLAGLGQRSTRPGAAPVTFAEMQAPLDAPLSVFLKSPSRAPLSLLPAAVAAPSADAADFVWDPATGDVTRRASSGAIVAQDVTDIGTLDGVLAKWRALPLLEKLPTTAGFGIRFDDPPSGGIFREKFVIKIDRPVGAKLGYLTVVALASDGRVEYQFPKGHEGIGEFDGPIHRLIPGITFCSFGCTHIIAIATQTPPNDLRTRLFALSRRQAPASFSLWAALHDGLSPGDAVSIVTATTGAPR